MPTEAEAAEDLANLETQGVEASKVDVYVDGEAIDQTNELAIAQYQTWLRTWIVALNPQLSPIDAYEVSLRLTYDRQIQQLNADYRHQNKPTDVLSFAALETDFPKANELQQQQPIYLGDIIVSVETAEKQAHTAQHPLIQELAWLTAHGLLHLLGWDHPDEESLTRMLNKQADLLSLISVEDTL